MSSCVTALVCALPSGGGCPVAHPVTNQDFDDALVIAKSQANGLIRAIYVPDPEGLHAEARYAVCLAATRYLPGAYAFGTYAYEIVRGCLSREAARQHPWGQAGCRHRGGDAPELPRSLDQADVREATGLYEYSVGENTADPAPGTEEQALARIECLRVRAALATLPPRERHVLELRIFNEHTQAGAALRLGITRQRLQRIERAALAMLKAALGEDYLS